MIIHIPMHITCVCTHELTISDTQETVQCTGSSAAALCLKLPGKNLYLTPLLKAKKFRNVGYKTGAMSAFRELETAQLGTVEELGAGKGTRTVSCINCILYEHSPKGHVQT